MSSCSFSVGSPNVADRVRLSAQTLNTIRAILRKVFPESSRVILFGSRVCPDARGGDIDLLVIVKAAGEALARARLRAIAQLQMALGEQHIDLIVTSDPEKDSRRVVQEAIRTGVPL